MEHTVQIDPGKRRATVFLKGRLTAPEGGDVYERVAEVSIRRGVDEVVLDFSGVEALDSAGVAVVSLLHALNERGGKRFVVRHLRDDHKAALDLLSRARARPAARRRAGLLERVGGDTLRFWDRLLLMGALFTDTLVTSILVAVRKRRLPRGSVLEQAIHLGVNALPVVGLLSLLLGLILSFMGALQLRQLGAEIYTVDIVAISMIREFGPLITAIILTGRSGASIAAELGTMTVQEETDALRAMGIEPVRFLVVPRMAAMSLVQPSLTLMSIAIGLAGAYVITNGMMGISLETFLDRTTFRVPLSDVWLSLLKALTFAWIIGFVACHLGLHARGGAAAVGRATTRAVVASIFLIIVADSVYAAVYTMARFG